jgi:hypothetical protein
MLLNIGDALSPLCVLKCIGWLFLNSVIHTRTGAVNLQSRNRDALITESGACLHPLCLGLALSDRQPSEFDNRSCFKPATRKEGLSCQLY